MQCSVLKDIIRLAAKKPHSPSFSCLVCSKFNQTQNVILQHSFQWNEATASEWHRQCFLNANRLPWRPRNKLHLWHTHPFFLTNNNFELCFHHLRILDLDHYLDFLSKKSLKDLWDYWGRVWGKVNSSKFMDSMTYSEIFLCP